MDRDPDFQLWEEDHQDWDLIEPDERPGGCIVTLFWLGVLAACTAMWVGAVIVVLRVIR